MIKHIKTSDLRRMQNQEGLILQGCGGSLQEWVDGRFKPGLLVIVPTSSDYKVAAVTRVVDYVKKDAPYPLYKMKEVSCVATPKNIKRFQIASGIATFVLDNTGKNNAKDDLEWIDQIEMWDALMN